jgi:thiamine biosynthesis lipoprotein ApbE
MPADHFRSVTVVTDNAALADALSTALFVKTYEEGLALIENLSEDVECYWITEDLQILYTDGMADLLEKQLKFKINFRIIAVQNFVAAFFMCKRYPCS